MTGIISPATQPPLATIPPPSPPLFNPHEVPSSFDSYFPPPCPPGSVAPPRNRGSFLRLSTNPSATSDATSSVPSETPTPTPTATVFELLPVLQSPVSLAETQVGLDAPPLAVSAAVLPLVITAALPVPVPAVLITAATVVGIPSGVDTVDSDAVSLQQLLVSASWRQQ